MGYIDKQVAAAQKRIGDAVSGKNLRSAIRKLQEKSQIRDTLEEARARGAIVAKRKLATRTGTTQGDFIEVRRTFHSTQRELRSSDGLFVLLFYNTKDTVMNRATFTFLDYDPDA